MLDLNVLRIVLLAIFPVLFAITVHEAAHGWAAKQLGDPTAERLGRLTLNPLKHVDPIGTFALPLVLLAFTGIAIGWAKPVPISWQNLRHPKRDMALVAAAGPGVNLLMALMWLVFYKLLMLMQAFMPSLVQALAYMAFIGIFINILLMVFNLLPLPPLDGGRVAVGLLPGPWAWRLSRLEPYGIFIVIGAIMIDLMLFKANHLGSFVNNIVRFMLGA